jgi:excisionase family DNA binding protein
MTTQPRARHAKSERMLTVSEVAARWNVSARHVLDLIHLGRLPAVHVGGSEQRRLFRVAESQVVRYENRNAS